MATKSPSWTLLKYSLSSHILLKRTPTTQSLRDFLLMRHKCWYFIGDSGGITNTVTVRIIICNVLVPWDCVNGETGVQVSSSTIIFGWAKPVWRRFRRRDNNWDRGYPFSVGSPVHVSLTVLLTRNNSLAASPFLSIWSSAPLLVSFWACVITKKGSTVNHEPFSTIIKVAELIKETNFSFNCHSIMQKDFKNYK